MFTPVSSGATRQRGTTVHKGLCHDNPFIQAAARRSHKFLKERRGISGVKTLAAAARVIHAGTNDPSAFGNTEAEQLANIKHALIWMNRHKLLAMQRKSGKLRLTTRGIYADYTKSGGSRTRIDSRHSRARRSQMAAV